jgi:hypothetical protein
MMFNSPFFLSSVSGRVCICADETYMLLAYVLLDDLRMHVW